ncbi:hypothetical protein H4R24_001776 [Coemansia sp. RSA 988]|nr:hypothetical protein H4R24_001776 [Coemansia sp. RSA 988]
MQHSPAAVYRQRLASINDSGSPRHSQIYKRQPQQQAAPSQQPKQQQQSTPQKRAHSTTITINETAIENDGLQQPFISEDYLGYLSGGPFNRFALALKSALDNEIDWACARLTSATQQAPEGWGLVQHAPFLIEAILGVLERSRKELTALKTKRFRRESVHRMVLADSGQEMVAERARGRAGLLSTALFNIAQVGENATAMAQDPRIAIEATHWLQLFHEDSEGLVAVKAEFLDLMDVLLPLTPAPPLDAEPLRRWPAFGMRESSTLDPLALVEACLWSELVRLLCYSQERKLVVGAIRIMVQSIAWHPQLARCILDLPVPRWAMAGLQQHQQYEYVGELVNNRLAELVLSPEPEIASACFELLLNTVRLEAMAQALDDELDMFAIKAAAAAAAGNSSGSVRRQWQRKTRGGETDTPGTPSGGESGSQTPVFGFRPTPRQPSVLMESLSLSEPSMLPEGLVSLVALVLQQWMSATCPPPQVPAPLMHMGAAGTRTAMASVQNGSRSGTANGTPQKQQQDAGANRPPTELELREACTWVLLNYELNLPSEQQKQQSQSLRNVQSYVMLNDLFNRYKIAKSGQTVPRIGRALNLSEIVRVVAAVFPSATLQTISVPQRTQPSSLPQQMVEATVALHLKPRSQHIVPIPQVTTESQQKQQEQQEPASKPRQANQCRWGTCSEQFINEEQALEHIRGHVPGADACRWCGCNRIPGDGAVGLGTLEQWIGRHALIHGPFYTQLSSDEEDGKTADASASESAETPAVKHESGSAMHQQLNAIMPAYGTGHAEQQEVVLRLVMQGVGLVEQLQKWADRRVGLRGEADRVRVWRCGDDVLERIAFVAAQPSPVVATYATRLLAIISKASVFNKELFLESIAVELDGLLYPAKCPMPPKRKARGGRPARGKRGASAGSTTNRRHQSTRSNTAEEANTLVADLTQTTTQPADDKGKDPSIQELATRHWLTKSAKWSEDVVHKVTLIHIVGTGYSRSNMQLLERQQYFERYLWPCYTRGDVDSEWLVIAIVLILNEKFQQRLHSTTWAALETEEGTFARLFGDIVKLTMSKLLLPRVRMEDDVSGDTGQAVGGLDLMSARSAIAQFLIVCFRSIETEFIRDALMPMVSISIWHHIEGTALMDEEFKRVPQLRKFWKHVNKKYKPRENDDTKQDTESYSDLESQRDFVPDLLRDFLCCLYPRDAAAEIGQLAYCVKFLELLADVLSQLATRRFVDLIVEDFHVVELCENSPWNSAEILLPPQSWLLRRFRELVTRLRALVHFQVDGVTGQALSDDAAKSAHYQNLIALQLAAFMEFPQQLKSMAVSGVDRLGEPSVLRELLEPLDHQSLCTLAARVGIRCHPAAADLLSAKVVEDTSDRYYTREFLVSLFAERFRTRPTVADQVRAISPYPSETLLFGDVLEESDGFERQPHAVTISLPLSSAKSTACLCYPGLSVPKLNLQFLSLHDYLLRCFELFRFESAYGIREDIIDAVRRLQPQVTYDANNMEDSVGANTHFAGWTRMALPMRSFDVTDVRRPRIGEKAPSLVRADISVDLSNYVESIVNEWDSEVRLRDVLIICSVQARGAPGSSDNYVVRSVRGCEVECRLNEKGEPIDERGDNDSKQGNIANTGRMRYFRVILDKHQYYGDMQQDPDVYSSLNVVLRRRPQENNFKGALESIRELMLQPAPLPDWLSSTFLGYGDPAAASALSRQKQSDPSGSYQVEFGDTFVSEAHLRASFPSFDVELEDGVFSKPCVIEFRDVAELSEGRRVLRVMHKPEVSMGPIELRGRRENTVRFTPAQTEAIHSAACEGLTLVVGPPGSGKTDVAVQIISNLYHAHPRQTILLVTHSNQALNQLFAKIINLDIEPRHLLRLGHGEGELDSDERYSKAGRVDSYLERRSALLTEVQRLADSLGLGTTAGDFAYTCENARFFFISHVRVRWEQYRRRVLDVQLPDASQIMEAFPFAQFIEEQLGHTLFDSSSVDGQKPNPGKLIDTVHGCFRYIESIFGELADIQPFELLRNHSERSNYLLTNQARIVAMTCTHAALKRGELLRLGFRYDTVVMEEAAQVLDIESLIPLTLQRQPKQTTGNGMDIGSSRRRLKRLVMIGDHNQLPPVIKNTGLRTYANMEQSLFTRLIRLNVPYIELNMQARARPQLASLYRFRYRDLGDLLPNVSERAFSRPNPGFLHELQFVDVGEFGNRGGESEPSSHFFQNVGEAEYVVAVFQYMRLLGYPADRIAILTTYNGQRALIRDVLERRCGWLSYFGQPAAVSTVDQFQGQQADYVLLSLVRTKNVGHIRDLRRLTVALSRARLGLYVFARRSLFESCFELKHTMQKLLANGDRLELCNQEHFDLDQVWAEDDDVLKESKERSDKNRIEDVEAMGHLVRKMIEEHMASVDHPSAADNDDDADMADSGESDSENDAEPE